MRDACISNQKVQYTVYMKRIKEFMQNMTTQAWITTAIIGALILVILIGTFITFVGYPSKNRMASHKNTIPVHSNKEEDSKTDEFIDKATDTIFVKPDTATSYVTNTNTYLPPVVPAVSYNAAKQEVQIALIIEENEYNVKNIIEGVCGNVYMVTAYVPGPTILTNSFKALFGDKVFGDFMPGNIIPSYHPDLKFKEVVITNGIAKIYLTGSFTETEKDSCDTALAIAQLTETAENYPNVKSVEIYLGSKKVN